MKISSLIINLVIILSLITSPLALASQTLDTNHIDEFINEEMRTSNIPGLSLSIIKNGEIVHIKEYGQMSVREPSAVESSTPFLIGSLTKSLTALAVMQLVDQGLVNLDSYIDDYISWFNLSGEYSSNTITIRHLLNQTSSIPNNAGLQQMSADGNAPLEEEVQSLSSVKTINTPGLAYEYSNANYLILGLLIEYVTGISYQDYLSQHVLEPLGMKNTYLTKEEALNANMASGHIKWFGFPTVVDGQYLQSSLPAGFIFSSIEDMSKYLLLHINYNEAHQNILVAESFEILHDGIAPISNTDFKYAMGLIAIEDKISTYMFHDGATQGYNAAMAFSPSEGWGVIVLTNVSGQIEQPAGNIVMSLADYLRGEELLNTSNTPRIIYYTLLLAIFILLIATIIATYTIFKKYKQRLVSHPPIGILSKLTRVYLPGIVELIIPLFVFIIIPRGAGFPVWKLFSLFHPDLTYGLLILSAILLLKGISRIVILLKYYRALN